jgi:hypothetical protein
MKLKHASRGNGATLPKLSIKEQNSLRTALNLPEVTCDGLGPWHEQRQLLKAGYQSKHAGLWLRALASRIFMQGKCERHAWEVRKGSAKGSCKHGGRSTGMRQQGQDKKRRKGS